MQTAPDIATIANPPHRKVGTSAPFLPMSRAEMDALGWEQCDVILVTGEDRKSVV